MKVTTTFLFVGPLSQVCLRSKRHLLCSRNVAEKALLHIYEARSVYWIHVFIISKSLWNKNIKICFTLHITTYVIRICYNMNSQSRLASRSWNDLFQSCSTKQGVKLTTVSLMNINSSFLMKWYIFGRYVYFNSVHWLHL